MCSYDPYDKFVIAARQACRNGELKNRLLFKDFCKEVYEYNGVVFRFWGNGPYIRWQFEIDGKIAALHSAGPKKMVNNFENIDKVWQMVWRR